MNILDDEYAIILEAVQSKIQSTICQKLLKNTGQNENKKMMQARKAKKKK